MQPRTLSRPANPAGVLKAPILQSLLGPCATGSAIQMVLASFHCHSDLHFLDFTGQSFFCPQTISEYQLVYPIEDNHRQPFIIWSCKFWFLIYSVLYELRASLVAQRLKRLPAKWETWVRSLGQEDSLEKEMATHSSILAWRIPWREEPGRLQSTGLQRIGHD